MFEPRTCRNTSRAFTNNNGTLILTPAVFCTLISLLAQTLVPTEASTLAHTPVFISLLAPALILDLVRRYIDKNLQKITKLALELFVRS